MTGGEALSIWTVYDHPTDFPNYFVARRFEIRSGYGHGPTAEVIMDVDLERLRDALRQRGLVCLARERDDDRVIVESWL